jgi:ketosteroid isomerase-like protein
MDYRLEECRADRDDRRYQSNGEAAMSAAANKKLVEQVYTDSANRSGTTFADNLADDASWIVTGQYSWSHEFKGRDAIQNGLMGHFRSFFAVRPRTWRLISSRRATTSWSRRAATT